jgi:hypothetical protein
MNYMAEDLFRRATADVHFFYSYFSNKLLKMWVNYGLLMILLTADSI